MHLWASTEFFSGPSRCHTVTGNLEIRAIALVSILVSATFARADNWPNWRGPTYDGICHEKNLPTEWGTDTNLVWSLKMPGRGSSTPIVWGDRIFVTAEDEDGIALICVSTSGKELWRQKIAANRRRPRGD